ncbi:MAG: DUF354 domain-containing protein [Bacteroidetes bacterium]|uniref:DUF354 domain-containing protein n=1 Tax=Candidatus Gallipaludibacter merdavium TaxID=2840839 RepID=A0A9D9HUG7_9BACT|nr:DUF354 domain-containing protein [Candidatus Gallipaludibacter merdavium]
MNILIDIGHPAHVHMFKHAAHELMQHGHKVLFTTRDKEFEIRLLKEERLSYISLGKKRKSLCGKIYNLIGFDYKVWKIARQWNADIFLSHGSITASHVAFIMGKPHIAFEDTFNFEQVRLYKPFTKVILTSDYRNPLTKETKNISYAGYNALLYLHPKRFKPDKSVLQELGVSEDDKYVIIRFVAWNASHDMGHKGIAYENKIKAIQSFLPYAKVFISSEKELPQELEQYRIRIAPERMHDAMAFASLVFGESSTMVEEAAMLGVPSMYFNGTGILYTNQLDNKYGLCFDYLQTYENQLEAISKAVEILSVDKQAIVEEYALRRKKMLSEKIDVTAFLVWFVENYPKSVQIMKENPDYQYNFK